MRTLLRTIACLVVVALVAAVGTERSSQTCGVCMSSRTARQVGIDWPVQALVPLPDSNRHDTALYTTLLAPAGHAHVWISGASGFSSIMLRRVAHGRPKSTHFKLQLALSPPTIQRAAALIRAGDVTLPEIEEALLFSTTGTGREAVHDRVRDLVTDE